MCSLDGKYFASSNGNNHFETACINLWVFVFPAANASFNTRKTAVEAARKIAQAYIGTSS
jgi:hypothetical protein